MKSLFKEFKEFISRGNVIDLAVGVIIGGAFQGIVNSFVEDIVMPLIGLATGGIDLANQFLILKAPEGVTQTFTTVEAATEAGCTVWPYGSFISAVLSFLILAIVIFLFVKGINKLRTVGKKDEEEAPTTKECPYCKSEINIEATKCPHCASELPNE